MPRRMNVFSQFYANWLEALYLYGILLYSVRSAADLRLLLVKKAQASCGDKFAHPQNKHQLFL